jgi:hypothetical protein
MADLNALIAQGAQFRVPPPVDPMGNMPQLMQMRAAQNQNALAQYQLSSARREDASTNALNTAYQNAYDPVTGKIDSARLLQSLASSGAGSKIPGVQKLLMEAENELLKRDKLKGEIAAQPGDAAYRAAQTGDLNEKTLDSQLSNFNKRFSPLSVNGPDDVRAYTIAMYNDPKLGPLATRMKSLDEALQANLAEFAKDPNMWKVAHSNVSGKDIFEALKGTRRDVNLGNVSRGSTVNAFGNVVPGSQVDTSIGATPSTDAAMMQARAAQQQASTSAGQLGVAKDRLANEGQGVTYIQNADGGYTAVPSRLAPGVAPVSRTVLTAEGVPLIGKDASRTGVSEQQAAYNIGRVLTAANQIKGITGKDPSAMKPGGAEALASSVGLSGTANLARSANRQIVQGAQRDALDALLYLATGAAYNKEQLLGQMEAYIPAFTDTAKTVAAKQTRMADLIQSAKTRAGKAWTPEMDAAMKALMSPSNVTPDAKVMPAPPGVDPALWGAMTPEEQKLWAK